MRNSPTRLRATKFCTSSARFAPEFVKATKRYRMHANSTKRTKTSVWVPMGWIGCVRYKKSPTRLRGMNFCTSWACLPPSFVRQPNDTECNQIVRNAPKFLFRVQWGGSGAFVAKNSNATSWHELLQKRSARFPQSFVRQPNGPECTQIVGNAPKFQFRVRWGGSGAFVAKNSDATSWHELLH